MLRKLAPNKADKDLFKFLVNSIFGKTMEKVENRVDVKLFSHFENVGKGAGAERYISKSHFKNTSIFSENLVAVEMEKVSITFDKPVYVGFSILDL